jgi:hypothetical protein
MRVVTLTMIVGVSGEHGRVKQQPLPKLLVGLRDGEVTGLVEITEGGEGGQSSSLYLRRGRPVHVARPDSLDRLDQVLIEAGILTSQDLAVARAVHEETGRLMGQLLRELRLVDEEQLAEALRLQLRRKVTRLFSSAEGTVEVSPGEHRFGAGESSPGHAVEPRTLVFPGIEASYDRTRLAAELAGLSGKLVRLPALSDFQLTEMGFSAAHGPLLNLLQRNGFRIEPRWINDELGPRAREAKAILLSLMYLGLLQFPEELVRAVPVVPVPTPASGPALPPDPEQLLANGERHFRNGDLVRAERAFDEADRLAPWNLRVRAFLIWIHFWKQPDTARKLTLERTLNKLVQVVNVERAFAYGHYFVGELLKLRNQPRQAEAAFNTAVRHDPTLIEAQRALRLMKMRAARG